MLKVEIIGGRKRVAARTIPGALKLEKLTGIFEGERAEEKRVHQTEHRDRSADADREGEDGDERHGRRFEE